MSLQSTSLGPQHNTDRARLLKRRQIRDSKPCAIATALLLREVVAHFRTTNDMSKLIDRVQRVGQRLQKSQPRELTVGNIVRRVLGVIRDELEEDRDNDGASVSDADSRPHTPPQQHSPKPGVSSPLRGQASSPEDDESMAGSGTFHRPPLMTSHTSYAASGASRLMVTSMFNLLDNPFSNSSSPGATPGSQSPANRSSPHRMATSTYSLNNDLKAEVLQGIEEIIEELESVYDQISSYALEQIHANEIILTLGSSLTVQKFLLKAATKRKFTVIHAEGFPNDHIETHAAITSDRVDNTEEIVPGENPFIKPLIKAGITVVLIPDHAVFALMSRVNKVILGTHVVLANGGLVAAAGSKTIAKAASMHRTPVVVVTGVYKLSPIYPFDFDSLIEYGDSGKVIGYDEGDLVETVDVLNPLFDYVPAELIDLYITNLLVFSSTSPFYPERSFMLTKCTSVADMPHPTSTESSRITTDQKTRI